MSNIDNNNKSDDVKTSKLHPLSRFIDRQKLADNNGEVTILSSDLIDYIYCSESKFRLINLLNRLFYIENDILLKWIVTEHSTVSIIYLIHNFDFFENHINFIQKFFSPIKIENSNHYFTEDSYDNFIQHMHQKNEIIQSIREELLSTSETIEVITLTNNIDSSPKLGFKIKIEQLNHQFKHHCAFKNNNCSILYLEPCFSKNIGNWIQYCVDFPLKMTRSINQFIAEMNINSNIEMTYHYMVSSGIEPESIESIHLHLDHVIFYSNQQINCGRLNSKVYNNLVISIKRTQINKFYEDNELTSILKNLPYLKVLLIEDNEIYASILARNFERAAQVHIESTVKGSLAYLNSAHSIDLIIVDAGLPDGTGFDFMSKRPDNKLNIPCVLHTAHLKLGKNYEKAGFIDFVPKVSDQCVIMQMLYSYYRLANQ